MLADSEFVEVADISRQRLPHTSLVVLAACGTARGRIWRNEGVGSPATAFLQAGARTVVGTLWDIEDESSLQMFRQFHKRIRDGATPAEALRDAQLWMLRSNNSLDRPALFAAVVIGTM
jgi:CHAT domain-containing protein